MTVAVTGGTGLIGRVIEKGIGDAFSLRLLDRDDADVADLDALTRVFEGCDAVVHLAASAEVTSSWDEVLPANLIGAYNAYEAAIRAGARRVVFASSNHAVGMYQHDDDRFAPPEPVEVPVDAPVRPDSLYGASKAWGEALGRFYAEQRGLEVVSLRIGWVTRDDEPPDPDTRELGEPPRVARRAPGMWLSHRDCADLVGAALTADLPPDRYAVANGVSANAGRWLSLDAGREILGWEPKDGAG